MNKNLEQAPMSVDENARIDENTPYTLNISPGSIAWVYVGSLTAGSRFTLQIHQNSASQTLAIQLFDSSNTPYGPNNGGGIATGKCTWNISKSSTYRIGIRTNGNVSTTIVYSISKS